MKYLRLHEMSQTPERWPVSVIDSRDGTSWCGTDEAIFQTVRQGRYWLGWFYPDASPVDVDVDAIKDENERLRAIVDKLPTTADGVPVVPGTAMWRITRDGVCEVRFGVMPWTDTLALQDFIGECFSTKEAAEAKAVKP